MWLEVGGALRLRLEAKGKTAGSSATRHMPSASLGHYASLSLGIKHRERQRAEIRSHRSGVKLISDLRLLTSVIDDFYVDLPLYRLLLTMDHSGVLMVTYGFVHLLL